MLIRHKLIYLNVASLMAMILLAFLSWTGYDGINSTVNHYQKSSILHTKLQRLNLLTSEYMRSRQKERVKNQWNLLYDQLSQQLPTLYPDKPQQTEALLTFHHKLKQQFLRLTAKSRQCEEFVKPIIDFSDEEMHDGAFLRENQYCRELMERMTNQTLIVSQELSELGKQYELLQGDEFQKGVLVNSGTILGIVFFGIFAYYGFYRSSAAPIETTY